MLQTAGERAKSSNRPQNSQLPTTRLSVSPRRSIHESNPHSVPKSAFNPIHKAAPQTLTLASQSANENDDSLEIPAKKSQPQSQSREADADADAQSRYAAVSGFNTRQAFATEQATPLEETKGGDPGKALQDPTEGEGEDEEEEELSRTESELNAVVSPLSTRRDEGKRFFHEARKALPTSRFC